MLAAFLALSAQSAFAQDTSKALGELMAGRGVSIDDSAANPGLTLISGSRIKTNADGRAVLNLSGIGRVTMGPEAELQLTFDEKKIGGSLQSGWAVISNSKGVRVEIETADGLVVADGDQPSSLRVDTTAGSTRVEAKGGASIKTEDKSEFVAAGEEVELTREGGLPSFGRRELQIATPSTGRAAFSEVLGVGMRGAFEEVTLDRTLAAAERALGGGSGPVTGPEVVRLTEIAQQTCGDISPPCPPCRIFPDLVKGKAGCSVAFRVYFENIFTTSQVSIRPFFSNACFRIVPGAPQTVQIAPGGAAFFELNALNCPRNANQFAQNSLIIITTNTCGTKTVQVEWATPCR